MKHPLFPPQLHVFVRDWLSANNIVLRSRKGNVLIDSGYVKHAPLTLSLLASARGLGREPLARLVNTHCHSDHIGGNAAVQAHYGCTISLPAAEAPAVAAWDEKALLLGYADQECDWFSVDFELHPDTCEIWGDLEWRLLAAPGHRMEALVFFNPEHRILISGDALWRNGFGFVMPPSLDPDALPATRATLDLIATLDARVVIPGHGEPFTHVEAALERAYARVAAFEADETRLALYGLKALLAFNLLARQRMALADLPGHLARVGVCGDLNACGPRLPPAELATLLVTELERSGVAHRVDGELRPGRADSR